MAYDTAQQGSTGYVLLSPSGYRAVFNNDTDADHIGVLTGDEAVTGLDSPEVRAAVYDRVEADGALFGNFYHGSRPITLSAELLAGTIAARNARETKLYKCVNDCMRANGTLTWTPTGSVSQFVYVRKFQPIRVRGGWKKDIFVSLVAADPYIYSTAQVVGGYAAKAVVTTYTNEGTAPREPSVIAVQGPTNGTVILRNGTGGNRDITMKSAMPNLAGGAFLLIDPVNRTVRHYANAAAITAGTYTDYYQYVDYANTTWWTLLPGANSVSLQGTTTTGSLSITHRHTWL